jgi:hypothetical protein
MEGAAMTTSEFALNGPALFNTSAMDLILATVPLHFQFPPIRALAIFPDILITLMNNYY